MLLAVCGRANRFRDRVNNADIQENGTVASRMASHVTSEMT